MVCESHGYTWDPKTCYLFIEDLKFATASPKAPIKNSPDCVFAGTYTPCCSHPITYSSLCSACWEESGQPTASDLEDDTWSASWVRVDRNNPNRPTSYTIQPQNPKTRAWERVLECHLMSEEACPLLYWVAKGWLLEGVLFQRDMDMLKACQEHTGITNEELGIEVEEIEEEN